MYTQINIFNSWSNIFWKNKHKQVLKLFISVSSCVKEWGIPIQQFLCSSTLSFLKHFSPILLFYFFYFYYSPFLLVFLLFSVPKYVWSFVNVSSFSLPFLYHYFKYFTSILESTYTIVMCWIRTWYAFYVTLPMA